MRALILSDVHANLEALEAVLTDADQRGGFDAVWGLGDLVGYGPDPNACIQRLQEFQFLAVAGNHDHAAIGKLETALFNEAAAAAARWTTEQLAAGSVKFLESLPEVAVVEPFTLVHGSLRSPIWEYLVSQDAALGTLDLLQTQFCLVGHSHIPFLCKEDQGEPEFEEFPEGQVIALDNRRWIINPGGVGQPRDGNPKPSYAIYDEGKHTLERHRVFYDIQATQRKLEDAGLPRRLIDRLEHGV